MVPCHWRTGGPITLASDTWIEGLRTNDRTAEPRAWTVFVEEGRYRPLTTTPVEARWPTKSQQLPDSTIGTAILKRIHSHFSANAFAFEAFAGQLFAWHRPGIVGRIDYTRPYRDGGRDAVGDVIAGISEPTVIGSFALEAKCHDPGRACGTKQTSRLMARLRYRMFGVFVTTSFVDRQAWREARLEDRHPVVFLTGRDLVEILRTRRLSTVERVDQWLKANHPV